MSFVDPLAELVSTLNFRRAISLITVILILGAAAWTVDYYTDYTRLARLEKTLSMLERLDALERRGETSKDLVKMRETVVFQLSLPNSPQAISTQSPLDTATFAAWFAKVWGKFLAGGLPWFLASLGMLPNIFKREKNALAGFVVLQFVAMFFGFVAAIIPPTGYFAVDYVLIPWGLLFLLAVVPISVAGIAAYKKVRESSLQKAIFNNLRQISAAADQWFLENGVNEVSISELVGPARFIKSLPSVDGESYDGLVIKMGQPIEVMRRSGESIRYG